MSAQGDLIFTFSLPGGRLIPCPTSITGYSAFSKVGWVCDDEVCCVCSPNKFSTDARNKLAVCN